MKIQVFKNPDTHITRDYDLSVCTVSELEDSLRSHCDLFDVPRDRLAVIIPSGEIDANEHIIKGTSTPMSMRQTAEQILEIRECYNRKMYKISRQENPSNDKKTGMNIISVKFPPGAFANGFGYFCTNCGKFFSVLNDPDCIYSVEFCPTCGEDVLINSTDELLEHCAENETDPVNYYGAFPPDEVIPQSRTGATPRQVEWITGCAISDKQRKLPVTIDYMAQSLGYDRKIVAAVFEELHITEKP